MKVGVPKEIKVLEYRVGMVPAGVRDLLGLSQVTVRLRRLMEI